MPARDIALVLIVVLAWGSNFSAMKLVLAELPPFLFTGLRTAVLLPLLLVLPWPKGVSWGAVLGLGLLIHVGQFGFLFAALRADASAGLGSLLIQAQVPFTILLAAALVLGERLSALELAGTAVVLCGLVLAVVGPRWQDRRHG